MLKNRSVLETEVNGRQFRLECCGESPIPDVIKAVENFKADLELRLKVSEPKEIAPEKEENKEDATP